MIYFLFFKYFADVENHENFKSFYLYIYIYIYNISLRICKSESYNAYKQYYKPCTLKKKHSIYSIHFGPFWSTSLYFILLCSILVNNFHIVRHGHT